MMHHQVLLSVTLIGPHLECKRALEDALHSALAQLQFAATTTMYPGTTLITAVLPPADLPPVELPVPPQGEEPVAVEVEPEQQEPAEPVAASDTHADVPASISLPATVDAPVSLKFEAVGRVLDLCLADEFHIAQGQQPESQLVVENVNTSIPGVVSFRFAGVDFKFPANEQHEITASIVVGEKNKRVKFGVAEASDQLQSGTIILGADDADLLTARE